MIIIEDNVSIGMDAIFICVSHELGKSDKRVGDNIYNPICVKESS